MPSRDTNAAVPPDHPSFSLKNRPVSVGTRPASPQPMTISGITRTLDLANRATLAAAQRVRDAQQASADGGGGQQSGGSQTAPLGRFSSLGSQSSDSAGGDGRNTDQVQLSDAATSGQWPTSYTSDPSTTSDSSSGSDASGSTSQSGSDLANFSNGFVESYVRKASSLVINIPGQGPFASYQLAFQVESAYRVVRPLKPGEVVDVQG